MELVEGESLAARLERGPLPVVDALRIARQVAEALESAHDRGIVHRDLKPGNIALTNDTYAKILDFGLAKPLHVETATCLSAPRTPLATSSGTMTELGAIIGTAAYMSPEQARGETVDARTDIWAFGCVLFEMLTGGAAFNGPTTQEMIAKILDTEPDWHRIPKSTPREIQKLLRKCLQKERNKRLSRFSDIRQVIDSAVAARFPKTWLVAAVAVALTALIATGPWWYLRGPAATKSYEPVSVLIADVQNSTTDPTFDRTLEQTLRRGLEGATFVNAFDRSRIRASFGLQPPAKLDETAAREIAVKQGVSVVLAGSIEPLARGGYDISFRATHSATGQLIANARRRVAKKDEVLGAAVDIVAEVRSALGDEMSDSAVLFAKRQMSATSLDAVRYHAIAAEALSNNKFEEARQGYLKAVEIDPNFGLAYQGLAVVSRNLGRLDDADKYIHEALRRLDGMTERERFVTRGFYYRVIGDYQNCVNEYGELVSRFAADVAGHNQRALCLSKLRKLSEAIEEMRHVVRIYPIAFCIERT